MREDPLQATEKFLTAIAGQVSAGCVSGAGKIGLRAMRIVNKHEVAKHLIPDVGDHHLTWHRDQAAFGAEAALDGIYVIRTSVPASDLDVPPRSPPTRTSLGRNAISVPSKLMTWTCGRSTTGSKTGSAGTC